MSRLLLALAVLAAPILRAQAIRPDSMRIASDSFATHTTGDPVGAHTIRLDRFGSGYRWQERIVIGALVHTLAIDLDSAMHLRRSESDYVLDGQHIHSSLQYEGARVLGRASPLAAQGRSMIIDTILPPGTFEAAAIFPVLFSRQWLGPTRETVTIFDVDDITITRQTFRILGVEIVTVPAGSFQAFHAELTTAGQPLTFWFTESRPYRLLKVKTAGGETVLIR